VKSNYSKSFEAIGRFVVLCTSLENMLYQFHIARKTSIQSRKPNLSDIPDFKKAIHKDLKGLSNFLLASLPSEHISSDAEVLIRCYFTKKEDANGEEYVPFIRWRNVFCHGKYSFPAPDMIHITFFDRGMFDSTQRHEPAPLEKEMSCADIHRICNELAQIALALTPLIKPDKANT